MMIPQNLRKSEINSIIQEEMKMGNVKIPLFKKADLDASIGVFFDGFSKVIVAIAILIGTFGLDGSTVFGTMMPAC